jgi:hypothetical protein
LFFTAKASNEREIDVNGFAGLAPTLQSEATNERELPVLRLAESLNQLPG